MKTRSQNILEEGGVQRINPSLMGDQDEDYEDDNLTEDESDLDIENSVIKANATKTNVVKAKVQKRPEHDLRDYLETRLKQTGNASNNVSLIIFVSLGIVVFSVILYYFSFHLTLWEFYESYNSNVVNENKYMCKNSKFVLQQLGDIKNKFPSQPEDLWYTFASGIQRLFTTDPIEPTTFLLFYKTDDKTVNCLIKEVSNLAAACFNGNASVFSIEGMTLGTSTFIHDSGELLKRFKSEITEKKIMIVHRLNDVPAEVAKEFHYLCDTYTPFVHEAIYFFTLKQQFTDTEFNDNKLIVTVNKELKGLWSGLEYNKLDPLITRITTNIIYVNNERDLSC